MLLGSQHDVHDDEALAKALHAELNHSFSPPSAVESDAELAKRLQAEYLLAAPLSPSPQSAEDEELARRLQAELNAPPPVDVADAVLAQRLAHSERAEVSAADEDASLALALALDDEDAQQLRRHQRDRQHKEQEKRNEQLRQHLFFGVTAGDDAIQSPSRSGSTGGMASFPVAPVVPVRSEVSYANVVGAGKRSSVSTTHGLPSMQQLRCNAAPSLGPSGTHVGSSESHSSTGGCTGGGSGPALLIDGANVACDHARHFEWRRLVACVDYFVNRGALGGRRLPRRLISVVLNENRYDASDADLASLQDVIMWTPTAKDDDVFLLQCAADHGSWVVTNDRWSDHRALRHATEAVRRRKISYAWAGSTFAPASDDMQRYDSA